MTHPGHLRIVVRRVPQHHASPESAPEVADAVASAYVGTSPHDARRSLEQVGPRVFEPALMAARHRMRTDVVSTARKQTGKRLRQGRLHASHVRHQRALPQSRRDGAQQLVHRGDRRRQHHEVRPVHRLVEASRLVDGAAPERRLEHVSPSRRTHDACRDPPGPGRHRDRPPQQAEPQHRDALEARRHERSPPPSSAPRRPASRRRRSALTRRSFSSGSPTLMRT